MPLAELTFADVERFINDAEQPEGQHLDYKREFEATNEAKKELAKDMTSFANSGGGVLVVGVNEVDGLPANITGTPSHVGRQRIDEWVNTVISAGTEPKVDYQIRTFALENEDSRVIVIIDVKDSPRKPHMVTIDKRNTYFRRNLDVILAATHQEVRDMFAETQSTIERIKTFLSSRNLLDEGVRPFAITKNSRQLTSRVSVDWQVRPIAVFSMIPMQLEDDAADPAVGPLRDWLSANTKGFDPIPGKEIFWNHDMAVDIEGATFPQIAYNSENEPYGYRKYLEVTTYGYIEAGLSNDLIWSGSGDGQETHVIMSLTYSVAYAEAFLRFAKAYYNRISLDDDIYYQISIANIKGVALSGFDGRARPDGISWGQAYSPYNSSPPVVKNYDNFKVGLQFNPNKLDDSDIKKHVLEISKQISRAFSLTVEKALDQNAKLDPSLLSHFL